MHEGRERLACRFKHVEVMHWYTWGWYIGIAPLFKRQKVQVDAAIVPPNVSICSLTIGPSENMMRVATSRMKGPW